MLALSDPHLPGLRWADERAPLVLPIGEERGSLQHMGLRPAGEALLAYDTRGAQVFAVREGAVQGALPVDTGALDFPLVADQARVWAGGQALDGALALQAALPDGARAVLATEDWLVAEQDLDLVVYEREGLRIPDRLDFDVNSPGTEGVKTIRLHET